MAISLRETFIVDAPIGVVWAFVMDPHRVAQCMPGATLEGGEDDRAYGGRIQVKVGAITTSYQGRVEFVAIDEAAYAVEMLAEGRETGGGTARGGMSSRLRELEGGATEVEVEASVDVTGRIAQVSRGMIEGVSKQLFKQFVACAKAGLESGEEAHAEAVARASAPVSIVPVVLRVVWESIARFFQRLFGRKPR